MRYSIYTTKWFTLWRVVQMNLFSFLKPKVEYITLNEVPNKADKVKLTKELKKYEVY